MNLDGLLTESRNSATVDIDSLSTLGIVEAINREDQTVANAVGAILPDIAVAADSIVQAISAGGRLIYIGAGTSGRLGILDAAECPPTYGTDPRTVQGIIAGGWPALLRSAEGTEDCADGGEKALQECGLTKKDIVIGLSASGRTPFVSGGLRYARSIGCRTVAIACTPAAAIGADADLCLTALTGPEVIMGSTRMKAGTAQKMILNMLTTTAMIRLGKVYSNLMVDVQATNHKLRDRALRIVMLATGACRGDAEKTLADAGGSAKKAIVMLMANIPVTEAERLLQQTGGFVAKAIQSVGLRKT